MIALRWLYLGLVATTTASAIARLWSVLRVDGFTSFEMLYLALATILFAWISASFWLAAIGAYARWRGIDSGTLVRPRGPLLRASSSRTAIVFPVRNEEPGRLFAGIAAVCASVGETGAAGSFDFFILSDSTAPESLAAEQSEWRRLRRDAVANIYYRHRERNTGRKSGNIAQFCRNWGAHYDYMVVLDADSLMTGGTLSSLVRLMDANPRTALIQVPPELVGRDSLFARIQQFASSVYGPIYTAGLALLSGPGGNYWGHNAIIRVRPFMENCGLPELPGRAPLGGEIMSHDFVEAALLRRAGWEVHLASELGGSYEEPPPTLVDYLKRDRRWCQGNLQHIRLIFAQGFRSESRGHMASGVMSYLSSPLWLAMLVVSAVAMFRQLHFVQVSYHGQYPMLSWPISHTLDFVALISTVVILLYGPKLFALLLLLRDREAVGAHGGAWRAAYSVLLESVFSTLLAPIAMLSQSSFVARILLGENGGWCGQQRTEYKQPFAIIARTFAMHTALAAAAGTVLYVYAPGNFWWFALLLLGPVLAIPFAGVTGSCAVGRWASRKGLFLTPGETGRIAILNRVRATLNERQIAPAMTAPFSQAAE